MKRTHRLLLVILLSQVAYHTTNEHLKKAAFVLILIYLISILIKDVKKLF